MSKGRAAVAAKHYLKFMEEFTIKILPEGKDNTTAIIRVNPADVEVMKKLVTPSALDKGLFALSQVVLAHSTAMTAFNTITIGSQYATKGPVKATKDMFDRVLPSSNVELGELAMHLKEKAATNFAMLQELADGEDAGGKGGKKGGTGLVTKGGRAKDGGSDGEAGGSDGGDADTGGDEGSAGGMIGGDDGGISGLFDLPLPW